MQDTEGSNDIVMIKLSQNQISRRKGKGSKKNISTISYSKISTEEYISKENPNC